MWATHPDFKNVVAQVWENNPPVESTINMFAHKITAWACNNIGNIKEKYNPSKTPRYPRL